MRTDHPAAGAGLNRCAPRKHNDRGATPMKGTVKRLWLLLYTEGGWWRIGELREKCDTGYLQQSLHEMARRGYVLRRSHTNIDDETSVQYAVNLKCQVPRGVSVEEMWEVLQTTAGESKCPPDDGRPARPPKQSPSLKA